MLNEIWNIDYYTSKGEQPFYTDLYYRIQERYPDAGIKSTVSSIGAKYANASKHYEDIIDHFDRKYHFREIGAETYERWQYIIDRCFDNCIRRYDYYFGLYDNSELTELNRVFKEEYDYKRSYSSEDKSSNESTGNSKQTFNDTPIQQLMTDGNYATNITDGENSTSNSGNSNQSGTEENSYVKTDTAQNRLNIELADDAISIYRDLVDSFVNEFKNCFIDELTRM